MEHSLTNIMDVDVSNSRQLEFIVYSSQARSVSWIKREGYAAKPMSAHEESKDRVMQWSSNFWIYLIMFIHIAALVLGMLHFSAVDPPPMSSDRSSQSKGRLNHHQKFSRDAS